RSRQINEALSITLRKISALNTLQNNNEIAQDAYLKLQKQYKRKLKQLTQSHQHLLDDASSRSNALESQIEDIQFLLANIKIEESVKKRPRTSLSAASNLINTLISQAMHEKRDLEQILNQPEDKPIPRNPSPRRELPPIQPIVLRIKEATL
ncbi:MAG: CdvA-like protein, partial [Candidatus Bathyarchaeota archaeon]|nr:CdvA-like protein [Candidatus Bathyarchaeota archaeon]